MKQIFISTLVILLSLICLPYAHSTDINTPLFATFEDGTAFPFVLNQDGEGSEIRTQRITDNPLKEKNTTNKCIEVDMSSGYEWWHKTYLKVEDGTAIVPASDNHRYLHFYVLYPSGGNGVQIGVFNTSGNMIYQKEITFEPSDEWTDVVFDLSAASNGQTGIIGNNIGGIWIRPFTGGSGKCYLDEFELSDIATPRDVENLWNDPMLANFETGFESPFTCSIEGGILNVSADNPDREGTNNSLKVLHGDYSDGTDWWYKIKLETKAGLLIQPNTSNHKYLHFLSYRNEITEAELQIYDATDTHIFQKRFTNTRTNTWEEIIVDLTESEEGLPGIEGKEISKIWIMVNVGASTGNQQYYYDYFTLTDKAVPISQDPTILGEVTIGEETINFPAETNLYMGEVAYGTDTYPIVSATNGTGTIDSITQADPESRTATIFAITPDEAIRASFNIRFNWQPIITTPSGDIPLTPEALNGLTTITLKGDITEKYIAILNAAPSDISLIDMENASSITSGLSPINPNCLLYTSTPYSARNVVVNGIAEKILLEDNYAFNNQKTFTTSFISYKRTYPQAGWSSFCLPFDLETEEGMNIREFKGSEGTVIHFGKAEVITANTPYLLKVEKDGTTIEYKVANESADITVPASILSSINPDGKDYSFCNSFSTLEGDEVIGLYLLMEDGKGFGKAADGAKVLPFRGYIKYSGTESQSAPQLSIEIEGETTEIGTILTTSDELSYKVYNGILEIMSSTDQSITLYTTDGRMTGIYKINTGINMITGLTKGIYLMNNQKIVIY